MEIYLAVFLGSLVLGVAGDALLRLGFGLGFSIWIALACLALFAIAKRSRHRLPAETYFWLATAALYAAFFAWRASEVLLVMDLLATFGALSMAAIASGDPLAGLYARRLRDTLVAGLVLVHSAIMGILPVALRALLVPDRLRSARGRPMLRAIVLGLVVVVVFGSLLRSADPLFASFVELPHFEFENLASHVFLIGIFSWLAAGWLRASIRLDLTAPTPPDALPITVGSQELTTMLGALIVVFGAYVLSQLGWYFGGEQFLRERTGLTAATYARSGFFQIVFAMALVLPLLMSTRALLDPEQSLERRHTALSLPVIALLGATMLSAIARMRLYVDSFGLTTDRLYPLVFMGWLAAVLIWFALTVLRNAPRTFIGGALLSGAFTLAALNVADPDALVARTNLRRASSATSDTATDLRYLAGLNGNAVPLAVQATLSTTMLASPEQRCAAARELERRWGARSAAARSMREDAAWRAWNADQATALRVVAEHRAALRAVMHAYCRYRAM